MNEPLFGIDLGGTKIEGIVLDRNNPTQPLARIRLPTEASKGYPHIVSQISEVCRQLSCETGLPFPARIGIGTPGVSDPRTGLIKNSNTQCLIDKPLKGDLEKSLGTSFIASNDANCFALAETSFGCAKGYEVVFGVIMGTGVGAGLVVHGHILNGLHGIAGEWGQILLDPNGPPSPYAGIQGTVESYIAGPGVERFYRELSGQELKLRDIAVQAREGKTHAVEAIDFLTTHFARSLTIIIDVLDPDAIILGGGVGNVEELYSEATRRKIAAQVFNPTFETPILKPALGDSAGVFGAAMLSV